MTPSVRSSSDDSAAPRVEGNEEIFFLTSKSDTYTKGYSMQKKHRANQKITRRKDNRENTKKKENQTTD